MTNESSPIKEQSETVPTLSQITGGLPVRVIWAFVLATAAAFTAVGGAGFALGLQVGGVSAQEKLNAVSAQLAKAGAEAVVQTERAQQAAEKLRQYVDYASNLNSQVSERDRQIVALNGRLGQANTCVFLQEQIAAMQQQISNISSGKRIRGSGMLIISGDDDERRKRDADRKAQDDEEISQLQQRALAFTQQLSACAK